MSETLYGSETQKAVDNFPISGERVPIQVIKWQARIKGAAALVNAELGKLDEGIATKISEAAGKIVAGEHDDQFPIDVFQTGSGTSTNMNVNEVISALTGGEEPRCLAEWGRRDHGVAGWIDLLHRLAAGADHPERAFAERQVAAAR